MKRIQLFEFEDFKWFPDWTRSSLTKLIVILHNMMGLGGVVATLIAKNLKDQNLTSIVDLGSGAGGPMPEVVRILQEKHGMNNVQLLMTDYYPNPDAIKKFNTNENSNLFYSKESVDATTIGTAPEGLKTMVNCFHHMPPKKARKILSSAQESNQSLLIYEMAENKMPLIIWGLFLPLSLVLLFTMTLFMIPFVKPLTWREIVFTYLIPIIPITYAWDGQASMPRMYSMKDLDELTKGLETENYHWEKGYGLNSKNKKIGTYLLGRPLKNN